MKNIDPRQAVIPIRWLIGKWVSIEAEAHHKSKDHPQPFFYWDEMDFCFFGKSMLSFMSRKWWLKDGKPLARHWETGYLRINAGTNKLNFCITHSLGICSIEHGEIKDKGCDRKVMKFLCDKNIACDKYPGVEKIMRNFEYSNKRLKHEIFLQKPKDEVFLHITAVFRKIDSRFNI